MEHDRDTAIIRLRIGPSLASGGLARRFAGCESIKFQMNSKVAGWVSLQCRSAHHGGCIRGAHPRLLSIAGTVVHAGHVGECHGAWQLCAGVGGRDGDDQIDRRDIAGAGRGGEG